MANTSSWQNTAGSMTKNTGFHSKSICSISEVFCVDFSTFQKIRTFFRKFFWSKFLFFFVDSCKNFDAFSSILVFGSRTSVSVWPIRAAKMLNKLSLMFLMGSWADSSAVHALVQFSARFWTCWYCCCSCYPITQWRFFCDFQNASPPKWFSDFRWNSTELNYYRILHMDAVSATVLIPTPLCTTCEHGKNHDFP